MTHHQSTKCPRCRANPTVPNFNAPGSPRYLLRWPSGAQGFRVLVCCAANPSKAGQPDTAAQRLGITWSKAS